MTANTYQITYVVKPLGATHIEKVGGPWGQRGEQSVINELLSGISKYYVSGGGHEAWVEVERNGTSSPYLKTIPDGIRLDNLSTLPRRYA